MRDDAAPGPLTPASAPVSGPPPNRQIPRGETAPGRLGREDARNFGEGTLKSLRVGSRGKARRALRQQGARVEDAVRTEPAVGDDSDARPEDVGHRACVID